MASSPSPTTPAPAGPASAASKIAPYTPAPAGFRRPRAFLIVNGKRLAVTSASTSSGTHFAADSWSAETGLFNQPQGADTAFWDTLAVGTQVSVCFGQLTKGQQANEFPKSGNYSVVVLGLIDDLKFDRAKGTLSLSGRDLTSRLIDNKTSSLYLNSTASQAVEQIAKQFGFTTRITATTTAIGRYTNNTYAANTGSARPYWDLISSWARQENFDCYVKGTELYFGPLEADTDQQPFIYYLKDDGKGRLWGNVYEMTLEKNNNLAKDITVTVLSHSAKTGRSLAAYASRAGTRVPLSSRSTDADTTQNYIFVKPGLTQEQAQQWANAKFYELSKWERSFSVELEGDPMFSVRQKVIIKGTGSSFDTGYYLRTVSRTWDAQSGFTMAVSGKNVPNPSGDNNDDDSDDDSNDDGSDDTSGAVVS